MSKSGHLKSRTWTFKCNDSGHLNSGHWKCDGYGHWNVRIGTPEMEGFGTLEITLNKIDRKRPFNSVILNVLYKNRVNYNYLIVNYSSLMVKYASLLFYLVNKLITNSYLYSSLLVTFAFTKFIIMKLKILNKGTVVNNFVDFETAELKDTEVQVKTQTILVTDKEQFAFQYASIIGALNQLSGNAVKLLVHCSLCAEFNTNEINLNQVTLNRVSEQFGSTLGSLKHAIGELVKAAILVRLGSGMYLVNPRYYWRGEGPKRNTALKYMLEVQCPDC